MLDPVLTPLVKSGFHQRGGQVTGSGDSDGDSPGPAVSATGRQDRREAVLSSVSRGGGRGLGPPGSDSGWDPGKAETPKRRQNKTKRDQGA